MSFITEELAFSMLKKLFRKNGSAGVVVEYNQENDTISHFFIDKKMAVIPEDQLKALYQEQLKNLSKK